jgi:ElaB/YqjD/DUF883 family membrane-anchored ribosome-binding protein
LHVPNHSHSIESLIQKSEECRAELKETISQLSQTLSDTTEEIKTTFSPRHLKQEGLAYAKERRARVVETIKENPLQAIAIGAAAAYPLLGLVRRVPVPLALIGAGLLLSRKGGPSTRYGSMESTDGYVSESDTNGGEGFGDMVRSKLGVAQSSIADAGIKVKDRASEAAADAAAHAARMGNQAQDAIAGLVHRNPILVGGVAMAVGGLIAASLPASRMEETAVGEAGAALKRSGRKVAAEAIKGAKARVAQVADDISVAAREEGLTPEGLDKAVSATADKVASVAERAVDAALGTEPDDQRSDDSNDGDQNARF